MIGWQNKSDRPPWKDCDRFWDKNIQSIFIDLIIMTQIFHLPEDIRQEFSVDDSGKAYASQSAIARLCEVSRQAINQLLERIMSSKSLSESLQPFAGQDYTVSTKIPDVVVAAIINHYAMYARSTTEQAKKVCLCFQAIGIRSWIQEELGWKQEQKSNLSMEDMLLLADIGAKSALNAGVDSDIVEQLKLESLMEMYPESKPLLKPQKDAIAANNPIFEMPMTPTDIGRELALELGVESISAKAVNRKLLHLGYQQSITRTNSKGKEVHDYYQATEKGKAYSQLQMTAFVDGEGKSTKAQLRWFKSIVSILVRNWGEE